LQACKLPLAHISDIFAFKHPLRLVHLLVPLQVTAFLNVGVGSFPTPPPIELGRRVPFPCFYSFSFALFSVSILLSYPILPPAPALSPAFRVWPSALGKWSNFHFFFLFLLFPLTGVAPFFLGG